MITGPCNNRFPHNNRPLPDNPVFQPTHAPPPTQSRERIRRHRACLCARIRSEEGGGSCGGGRARAGGGARPWGTPAFPRTHGHVPGPWITMPRPAWQTTSRWYLWRISLRCFRLMVLLARTYTVQRGTDHLCKWPSNGDPRSKAGCCVFTFNSILTTYKERISVCRVPEFHPNWSVDTCLCKYPLILSKYSKVWVVDSSWLESSDECIYVYT